MDRFRHHAIVIMIAALLAITVTFTLFTLGLPSISRADDEPGTVNPSASVSLPNYYSDGIVFQHDQDIIVQGEATAGTRLQVSLCNDSDSSETVTAAADDGTFIARLAPPKAGLQPYRLEISSGDRLLAYVQETYVGNVFIAAGQSNMELNYHDYYASSADTAQRSNTVSVKDLPDTIDDEYVHFITLSHHSSSSGTTPSDVPLRNYCDDQWLSATGDSSEYLGYLPQLFAEYIRDYQSKLPVGIIQTAWNGTNITRHMRNGDIYNTHIAPFKHFHIGGILWYQGESDAATDDQALSYALNFSSLITQYRQVFDNNELPFLYVQLARYGNNDNTAIIRQAQTEALSTIPESDTVAMSVSIDTDKGTYKSIHPLGKDILAQRMANQWIAMQRQRQIPSSPLASRAAVNDSNIVTVYFRRGTASGLRAMKPIRDATASPESVATATEQQITGFEAAGVDGIFHSVSATVSANGNTVRLDCSDVSQVQQVRYLWAGSPQDSVLLYNDDELPMSPFTIAVRHNEDQ